jgi:glucose-6-phosphate isomerase
MSTPILWNRFQQHLCRVPALGLTLDVSRMQFDDGFLDRMAAPLERSFEAMDALERGAIASGPWHCRSSSLPSPCRWAG